MKVLISGGGTAGHINPALAIAENIKREFPDSEIAFVGTPFGMENKLVKKAGYEIYHVDVRGFQRRLTPKNISALWMALTSPIKAGKIIKDFSPDLVVGTGGYVSWPVLSAASKRNIPTVIHEQNAQAGVTTKMLSGLVDKVMISFDKTREQLKCKSEDAILTGNPVRRELFELKKEEERKKLAIPENTPYLLSFGGSLGARAINDAVLSLVKNSSLSSMGVYHTHAIGAYEWKKRQTEIESLDKKDGEEVVEYIYDMPSRMCAADIVICRAGAITLAELAVLSKPAILIPSPYVTDNHQYKNAKVVEDAGAGIVIEEKDLSAEKLLEVLTDILNDKARLLKMQKNARRLAIADTDEKIMSTIKQALKK